MVLDLEFYVCVLWIVVCPFVLSLLTIVLSVLHRYTDSDYPFDIFKLFLHFDEMIMFAMYQYYSASSPPLNEITFRG